jgi:uncharacterized protein (DUF2237 family)
MAVNVVGTELVPCSYSPLTGFFRDGCCNTRADDTGLHLVCTKVTAEFLAFSSQQGNDLVTPQPAHRFVGLKPGDRWCLCVARWLEALKAGVAPPVVLESTHSNTLRHVPLETLQAHALKTVG